MPKQKFKSYYVVWKLLVLADEKKIIFEFKSYYVVWKRVSTVLTQEKKSGLNRTMQYGNYRKILHKINLLECLNRTMQYGNNKN